MTALTTVLAKAKLSELCTLVTDGTHDTPKRVEAGFPLIKAKEIVGGLIDFDTCDQISPEDHVRVIARSKPEKGDTLFAHIGASLGEAAYVNTDKPFSIKNIALFKPDPSKIEARYLYYLVVSPEFQALAKSARTGSAQPFLSLGHLRAHPLRYHEDLAEQARIASILGAYDDLIEVNRRRIALLEEMAQRLFEETVVRPVGSLPEPNGTTHKPDLPNGWKVEPLSAIAHIIMGQSPPSAELNTSGLGLAFHQGVSDFGGLFPGRRVFCEYLTGKRVADEGDILFSVRAPVGRINCATERMILGRGVSAIRHRDRKNAYLLAHLRATFHTTDLIGNGAIYRAVNRGDIERVPIVVAPPEIMSMLNERLEDILRLIRVLYFSNTALNVTRDLLLPRLISGELSVATAERELEAVA